MNTNDENNWRTPAFRNNVVGKIEEAIQKSGMPTIKSITEMESYVYRKARDKDEYLTNVAKLILHIRELNSNKKAQMSGQQMQPSSQSILDAMNASRTIAHSRGNNQMMSNMILQQDNSQLNATSRAEAIKEWKNLRNGYIEAKKCMPKRSGSGRSNEIVWKYYDMLRFTGKYPKDNWKTIPNIPTIPSISDYTNDTEFEQRSDRKYDPCLNDLTENNTQIKKEKVSEESEIDDTLEKDNENEQEDELRDFCNSLYQSLKKLPRLSQLKLKRELMERIIKVEEEDEH